MLEMKVTQLVDGRLRRDEKTGLIDVVLQPSVKHGLASNESVARVVAASLERHLLDESLEEPPFRWNVENTELWLEVRVVD
jgi:hypothetical protein